MMLKIIMIKLMKMKIVRKKIMRMIGRSGVRDFLLLLRTLC